MALWKFVGGGVGTKYNGIASVREGGSVGLDPTGRNHHSEKMAKSDNIAEVRGAGLGVGDLTG